MNLTQLQPDKFGPDEKSALSRQKNGLPVVEITNFLFQGSHTN